MLIKNVDKMMNTYIEKHTHTHNDEHILKHNNEQHIEKTSQLFGVWFNKQPKSKHYDLGFEYEGWGGV